MKLVGPPVPAAKRPSLTIGRVTRSFGYGHDQNVAAKTPFLTVLVPDAPVAELGTRSSETDPETPAGFKPVTVTLPLPFPSGWPQHGTTFHAGQGPGCG